MVGYEDGKRNITPNTGNEQLSREIAQRVKCEPPLIGVSVFGLSYPFALSLTVLQRADCDVQRRKSFYWTL